MIDIRCRLPWPPSANHCWRATGRASKRIIISDDYKDFKRDVGQRVLEQHVPRFKTAGHRLAISIVLRAPTSRDYDIDNRVKTLLDALAYAGVIENDKAIDLIGVARAAIDPPLGSVYVRLKSCDAMPLGALHILFEMPADADATALTV